MALWFYCLVRRGSFHRLATVATALALAGFFVDRVGVEFVVERFDTDA